MCETLHFLHKFSLKTYFFALLFVLLLFYVIELVSLFVRDRNLPVILWWTPFMPQIERKVTCGDYKCIVTTDRIYTNHLRLTAYLFYGSNVAVDDLPLPKSNIPWAIYHEESPKNLAFFLYEDGQNLFEISSTFSRHSELPIPLQFLESVSMLTDLRYYLPVNVKNKFNIAPVLYIQSSCETPIERDSYVQELMKYVKVDSYGTCLNNKPLPDRFKIDQSLDIYDPEFMHFVAQYKFTIAIENSVCNDYVTEKLWRPLIVGSIPIYLGSPTINDWLPNNKSTILISNFASIKDLAIYINTLNENDDLYQQYMQHKMAEHHQLKITNRLLINTMKHFEAVDHTVSAFECFVCKSTYNKDYLFKQKRKNSIYECPRPILRYNTSGTFWMQHWDMGKCDAKTLQYFINSLKMSSFTKDAFDEQSKKYYDSNDCLM